MLTSSRFLPESESVVGSIKPTSDLVMVSCESSCSWKPILQTVLPGLYDYTQRPQTI